MTRIAAIDIGTNTILMLVADVREDGVVQVVRDEHTIARLGRGVDEQRFILPETIQRVQHVLNEYVDIARRNNSTSIVACGTSALRDAKNNYEFLETIRSKLGLQINVVSGDEEASLTYHGAVGEFIPRLNDNSVAVLDIGGGSTEVIFGSGSALQIGTSYDVGAVRITERILKQSPPELSALNAADEFIRSHFSGLESNHVDELIGVAGTVTTLAAINLKLEAYDREKVGGTILTKDFVEEIYQQLRSASLDEIHAIPQILPQRADIFLAGIMILRAAMNELGVLAITASDRGLRYGLLMKEFRRLEQAGLLT